MALDTREKRASAQSILGVMLLLPLPDATVGESDRAQVTWFYAGIDYINAVSISVSRNRFALQLHDKNGDLKHVFTRKANVQWEYLRTGGCGQADVMAPYQVGGSFDSSLRPGDELRVIINDEIRYSGKLLKIARQMGTGKEGIGLTFYGYLTELRERIISETYEGQEVSAIIMSILDSKIVGSKHVTYTAANIDTTDYTVTSIVLNHSVMDAIAFLAGLAGDVEWGVDRNKSFYFKKKDAVTRRVFMIGKDVASFQEVEDHENVINKVFVYGDAQTVLSELSVSRSDSIFGTREQNVFQSSISQTSDANRVGAVTLKNIGALSRQIKMRMKRSDLFLESSHPIGAATLQLNPFSTLKKYGNNYKYGLNAKYGSLKHDQISSIRYSMTGGGLDVQVVMSSDVSNLGEQQKRIEYEIKELQRR